MLPKQPFEHVEPPTRADYTEAITYLQGHPGAWVKIASPGVSQAARTLAYRIRSGKLAVFRPAGTFDAAARGTDVIACYKGDAA